MSGVGGRKRDRYFNGDIHDRQKKVYCIDRKLLPRIKECLRDGLSEVSVDGIVMELQDRYPEYKRKKRSAFRDQVTKVYGSISDEYLLNVVERNHLTKRRMGGDSEEAESLVNSDGVIDATTDSDMELLDEVEGNNSLNEFLTEIYSSKQRNEEQMTIPPAVSDTVTMVTVPDSVTMEAISAPIDGVAVGTATSTLKSSFKREKRNKPHQRKKKSLEEEIAGELNKERIQNDVPLVHPTTRFKDIGGCDEAVKEVCRIMMYMCHGEVFKHLGVKLPSGFLLHGPPGCGKTLLAHAIAGELNWPLLKLASTELVSGVSGESEEKIRMVFGRAKECSPCVLLLDDIDSISPKRETAQREMEKRIVSQLFASMDELDSIQSPILVIGTTSRIDSLDAGLRRSLRFDQEISLGIPDSTARTKILQVLCKELTIDDGLDYSLLAQLTPGYVGADLCALIREASMSAVNKLLLKESCDGNVTVDKMAELLKSRVPLSEEELKTVSIDLNDFMVALKRVQPSSKREGFATVPDVSWSDVGALENIREELSLAILGPVRYPLQYEALGLDQPSGVLLYGPPGCGKTLLAKAIANESGINFISVKGPELLNMYVGESEKAVRQVFQRATNSSPCVIFFDEIDALCPRRSDSAESSSSSRVVNQLLTEMDGLVARKQVFVIGATNRPDIIDPALLRPGRLDKKLYIGLPSADERVSIIKAITKNGTCPLLASDVMITRIACDDRCNGFSGADLNGLVREAAIQSFKEIVTFDELTFAVSSAGIAATPLSCKPAVHKRHFEEAFIKVKASVNQKERERYEGFRLFFQ